MTCDVAPATAVPRPARTSHLLGLFTGSGVTLMPLLLVPKPEARIMRAEIENLAEAAKQSIGLLRRHL
jgi:hypothetical protein